MSKRKLITEWIGRLKVRADDIERRMVGKTGIVLLHYRVGRLTKVGFTSEIVDADTLDQND